MEAAQLPLVLILTPAVAGCLAPLIGRVSDRGRDAFSVLMETLTLLIAAYATYVCFAGAAGGVWDFVLDRLNAFIALTVTILGFAATLYSVRYISEEPHLNRYYACLHFFVAGMLGMVFTQNVALMYVFLEIMTVASCVLVAHRTYKEAAEAGYKYIVLCTIGALFVLLGVALTYQHFGTLSLTAVERLTAVDGVVPMIIALSMIFGFGLKAGMVPLHAWLPDAHAEAPSSISCLLSGAMIHTAAFAMAKVLYSLFAMDAFGMVGLILVSFGVLSMIVGTMLALVQTDIKRLLAYSSVDQMGFILLGFGLGSVLGAIGAAYHILSHCLGKGLLFLSAGAVIKATGTRNFRELGGLSSKMPVTAVVSMIAALSLSGVPPFSGFVSEFLICKAAFEAGHPILVLVMLIVSVVTLAYLLRFVHATFFGEPNGRSEAAKEAPASMLVPMVILAALCILFGIFPAPVIEFVRVACAALLGGA